ncbi:hypothetical protein NUU61_003126 [Penicillium alfredii]|uniref:NmrA-like domain-containing protein n=1 Tax=Penicillium alfredii TaxID=1506179 RepID=A0A9W9KGK9_9EURO|nr:uncharacterized protein NUU61_003126 [Penicillium alfredii]KAJ5105779.1 hypothetical protein NUU61_003126 [Penicillium alfredii]
MTTVRVALAGASGNLGPAILNALLSDPSFIVTILSRSGKKPLDARAKVTEVDFQSLDSLTAALTGQDVVVNILGSAPVEVHLRLIDACLAAGVQRILPSEFGSDTTNPLAAKLPIFQTKVDVQRHLKDICQRTASLSYTLLINGPFLDFGLQSGHLLKLSGANSGSGVEVYDGGHQRFSTTTVSGAARAVVSILKNLEATRNTVVYVREADLTQSQLLKLAGLTLPTINVQTGELALEGYAELQKEHPDSSLVRTHFLKQAAFGEGFGGLFDPQKLANGLLGVKELSEEDLVNLVARYT